MKLHLRMAPSLDVAAMLCALIFALNFCVEVLVLRGEERSRLILLVVLGIVLALWAGAEVAMYARAGRNGSTRRILVLITIQLAVECSRLGLLVWAPDSDVNRPNWQGPPDSRLKIALFLVYVVIFLAILRAILRLHTEELRQMAVVDALTGVFNRGHLETRFRDTIARGVHPISMLLIDIDNFKKVNDVYGHRVGDLVLVELAALVAENVRSIDALGRWGGEEFAVLLPACSASDAHRVAEALRTHIADHDFATAGSVTASFGVAEAQPGEEFESWFQRTDAALYRAKQAGRNVIEVD